MKTVASCGASERAWQGTCPHDPCPAAGWLRRRGSGSRQLWNGFCGASAYELTGSWLDRCCFDSRRVALSVRGRVHGRPRHTRRGARGRSLLRQRVPKPFERGFSASEDILPQFTVAVCVATPGSARQKQSPLEVLKGPSSPQGMVYPIASLPRSPCSVHPVVTAARLPRRRARRMKLRNLRRQVHRLENLLGNVLGLGEGDQAERDSPLRGTGFYVTAQPSAATKGSRRLQAVECRRSAWSAWADGSTGTKTALVPLPCPKDVEPRRWR